MTKQEQAQINDLKLALDGIALSQQNFQTEVRGDIQTIKETLATIPKDYIPQKWVVNVARAARWVIATGIAIAGLIIFNRHTK